MRNPLKRASTRIVAGGTPLASQRVVPEEVPVALVYDGSTHAVMMATPSDLEDFALGFSISEGKVDSADEIAAFEIVEQAQGIELRMWLTAHAGHRIAARRRALLGPTGCGICGVESLDAALPALPEVVAKRSFTAAEITSAVAGIAHAQTFNREARAMHAAAFWQPGKTALIAREDVGRHNALDKLVGALTRESVDPAAGVVVLTSRVSVEMVQKAAVLGAPVIAAVSAPTALAIRTADACGITLAAIARGDSFEIFSHPHRIVTLTAGEHTAAEPVDVQHAIH